MTLVATRPLAPVAWEQFHAGRVNFKDVGPQPCNECGSSLNVEPVGNDLDGYMTRDLLFIPWEGGVYMWAADPPKRVLRQKLGGVRLCQSCLLDPGKAAARARRRRRVKHMGNYID